MAITPQIRQTSEPVSESTPGARLRSRWVVAVAAAALIAALALALFTAGGRVGDDSAQVAESQRMLALAPTIADSFDVAEKQRMLRLSPGEDDSHDTAERQRMIALKP